MDSQLASLLKRYIENTINDLPHQTGKLHNILNSFARKQQFYGIAIVKLVQLIIEYPKTGTIDQTLKKQRSSDVMAKILECLSPLLNISAPLLYLIHRNFQTFISSCEKKTSNKYIQELASHCQGLYPPNEKNGKGSIFSFHSQNKQPFEGNPNWLYSRYLVKTWFNLHSNQMSQQIQQVYSFLISSQDCLGGSNIVHKLWGTIYSYYTQQILDQSLQKISVTDERYLTWSRVDQTAFKKSILDMQLTISQQQSKLLYYLVLLLLDLSQNGIENQIKKIYALFTNYTYQDVYLQLITNTLFLRIAKTMNLEDLRKEISSYGHKLIEIGPADSNIFLPLFYSTDQILEKITNKNVSFIEIPLNEAQKRQISLKLFKCHKLRRQNLQYLSIEHFLEMFTSNKWKDSEYLQNMLELMQEDKKLFTQKLMTLAQQIQRNSAIRYLEIFLQAWEFYRMVLITDVVDYTILQKVLSLRKNDFRKKYQFMIIPRELPDVIFKILLSYAKYFNQNKIKLQIKGKSPTLLNQFEERTLPELLTLIDETQRDLFWKQWITVKNTDQNFVYDIINAAQRPIQN